MFESWLTSTWLIIVSVPVLLISLVILDKASHATITYAVRASSITGFGKITHASQIIGIILLVIFIVYIYQLSKIKTVREERRVL